jgi:hypothetical protein
MYHLGDVVRFEFLTASSMKMRVFWDIAPYSLAGVDRRFKRAYCFHHPGIQRPDAVRSTQVLNVGLLQQDYTALYPRRR